MSTTGIRTAEPRPEELSGRVGANRVVIMAALTGALAMREQSPHIPYTPEEIAEEAIAAYEAGASIVHLHAREPATGRPSVDLRLFETMVRRIRDACPVLINLSTGTFASVEERLRPVLEFQPEFAALNMGPINFGIWSRSQQDVISAATEAEGAGAHDVDLSWPVLKRFASAFHEVGTRPEFECFDMGHINNVLLLERGGYVDAPLHFSFNLGLVGGIAASPRNLMSMIDAIPHGSDWQAFVIGKSSLDYAVMAMTMGGRVRVGLEDNLYLRPNVLARSNAELVRQIVEVAGVLNKQPATPAEARQLLGLAGES